MRGRRTASRVWPPPWRRWASRHGGWGRRAPQAGGAGSERRLQASLSHAREADDLSGVAYALAALGELALRVGDPQAVPLLEESRRRFTELRFPWGQGRALRGLATAPHRRAAPTPGRARGRAGSACGAR